MNSETLINDLIVRTKDNLNRAQYYKTLTDRALNYRVQEESWSILECIEHLNRYGNFYLPEIEKRMATSGYSNNGVFKTGWLGNYFAKSMLPKEKLNKMKTFKSMNPTGSNLTNEVLDIFINQQHTLLHLLNTARKVCLTKTKTGITISKWIKLRLGDTFRVLIYHNQRHIVQADRVLEVADPIVRAGLN